MRSIETFSSFYLPCDYQIKELWLVGGWGSKEAFATILQVFLMAYARPQGCLKEYFNIFGTFYLFSCCVLGED